MPHNIPEEKEWLHLRDAICLGDVDAIVDQLLMEGITVEYGEMESELISMKTNLGWDSCAVVDKETFKESINKLISESVAIPQPQDAPEFKTYKESVDSRRWDRIFDDMVGRASGRRAPSHYTQIERSSHEETHHPAYKPWEDFIAESGNPYGMTEQDLIRAIRNAPAQWPKRSDMTRGLRISEETAKFWEARAGMRRQSRNLPLKPIVPSHYTDETPEGVLEAMERRLSGERGTAQDLLLDALAQMELKVGELAEAVSRMGTAVPAPIVEAVEAVEAEMEVVEGEAEIALAGRPASRAKADAIRQFIINLGSLASEVTTATVADGLRDRFPDITERDVQNALRGLPEGTPRLRRRPTVRGPRRPVAPPPTPRGRMPSPRTVAIRDYALSLGAELANTSSGDIVDAISQQYPDVTGQEVLSALSVTWRAANNLPNLSPMRRGAPPAPLPPPPPVIETGQAANLPPGTSLIDRLRQMPRPERRMSHEWQMQHDVDPLLGRPRAGWMEHLFPRNGMSEKIRIIQDNVLEMFGQSEQDKEELGLMTYKDLIDLLKQRTRKAGVGPRTTIPSQKIAALGSIGATKLRDIITPEWLSSHGLPQLHDPVRERRERGYQTFPTARYT